jgi:hypothetical protein
MKKLFTAVCLAALLMVPSTRALGAYTDKATGDSIIIDVLLTRPLGIAAIAFGAGIFIIALPFTLPTRTVGTAADQLVAEPFRFTFVRPVGTEYY